MACNNTYPIMVASRLQYMPTIINLCGPICTSKCRRSYNKQSITISSQLAISKLQLKGILYHLSLYKGLILHNVKSTAHKQAHVSIAASNSSKQIYEYYHLRLISSHDESNNSNALHLVNCKETIGNHISGYAKLILSRRVIIV